MFGIIATGRLLRGLKLTVALIVMTVCLAAPTTARAQTDFALSNATAVLNGQQYSITGLFSVFEAGNASEEFFAQFQLTGSGPLARTYDCAGGFPLPGTCASPLGISDGLADAGGLQIGFSGSAITSVGFAGLPASFTDNAPTGVIVRVGGGIEYSFSEDAATVINGTPYSITGDFGYDPLTGYELGADINLNGAGPAPPGGMYFFDAEPADALNIFTATTAGAAFLDFEFANNLSDVADPLQELFGSAIGLPAAATGFVCPGSCPIATPEPGSRALLGTALGLFLLGFRVVRRAGKPPPDRPEGA
jgi:hypothetical protein